MARAAVPIVPTMIGMNYYHESMGDIVRTDAEIEADLTKILTLTNKIKIYHNPLEDNISVISNIANRAKARGFYVVWNENNSTTDLTTTTFNGTYTTNVLADAAVAQSCGVDEFLISNEMSLHIQGGDDLASDANNYKIYVDALKALGTSVQAIFTIGPVGVQEVWGQDYKWGNNDGLGSLDKIYFTLYESDAQFNSSLGAIQSYNNLGTPAIGEFCTAGTMDSSAGTDEELWARQISRRVEMLIDNDFTDAYFFTFRDTSANDNGRGFGVLASGDDTNFHTAWQSLFRGRRWFFN